MGSATAPNNGAQVPLRRVDALGYFAASPARMGHGNGSVTKGRVFAAAAFLLGLAGPLELEPGGY